MYSWTASGSIWYRNLLRHLQVPIDSIKWTIGPIDDPAPATPPPNLAPGVTPAPAGRAISAMLREGELDAIVSPLRPAGFDVLKGPLARLFPDFTAVETDYFRATGCYPIQHLVILRRAVVERAPWITARLVAAFAEAERRFCDNMWMFPYASPWLEADLERVERAMGAGYHEHDLGASNRRQLEVFCEEAHRSGLTKRKVAVDELFAEHLAAAKVPA
jgi:4,5-dihydroxyphthalate decarboxylase